MPRVMTRTTNASSLDQKTTQTRIDAASIARLVQGELRSSFSASDISSALRAGCIARPAVYFQKFIEVRTLNERVALHRSGDPARDATKRNLTRKEEAHGLFVCGAEHRRQRAAGFRRPVRQRDGREAVSIRLLEGE